MKQAVADVAVIGGGIIGSCIAERLQSEGKQVVLLDRNMPGEGCSKGNAGHFATDIILPLANFSTLLSVPKLLLDPLGPLSIQWRYIPKLLPWLLRFSWAAMPHKTARSIEALKILNRPSIQRFEQLLARTNKQQLMTQHGALTVFSSQAAARKNQQHAELVQQHGVNVSVLSGDQVRELEPNLAGTIQGGLYYPDTAHSINPHRLVTELAELFVQRGGHFIQQEVVSIDHSNAHYIRLKTHATDVLAKEVVIACGAWSKHLAAQIGHKVPLETERGYHLMLPQPAVSVTRPVTCFERSFVMTPMQHGLRLAGTVELAGLAAQPDYQRADALFQHAQHILPGVENQQATRWMGHRPSLPDSLPVIGRSPRISRVVFAFGHQHLGLTQAAVTADLISDIIQQKPTNVDLEHFRVDRF